MGKRQSSRHDISWTFCIHCLSADESTIHQNEPSGPWVTLAWDCGIKASLQQRFFHQIQPKVPHMNRDISHYTVYSVAPPSASSRTIVPEPGSIGEHSEATRTSVVFTTEMAPLNGRPTTMSTNKKRHHSITATNEEPQNLVREQKQCDSQLQLEESPASEKRRCQPPRATKAAAVSNIRHNAIPSTHMSGWVSEYSSDDSDGEFNPDKGTHATVWERRRMIGNRVGQGYDDHASTASSIRESKDRRLEAARFVRMGLGSQEPLMEAASNLTIQQMNATAEQLTDHDRLGLSPTALEADQVSTTAMDIDQQPDFEVYLSEDSSNLSTVDSMSEVRPSSPKSTVPPEAAIVKIERLSAVPEITTSGHALVADLEEPLPDAAIYVGQHDDNADLAATANTVEDFTPQSILRSLPVVLSSFQPSPEVLSVTKEMAAARVSRPSLPKRPSPQVHAGPLPRQASAEMQTGATDKNTDKIREIQSEPVSHLALRESSAQREVLSLAKSDIFGHTPSMHPQIPEALVHQRQTGNLRARHVSHDTALPSATGPSRSEEAPQAVPRFLYIKFRLMTTTSNADLAEFIHLIRAHAGCTDMDFLDCVKRYLTKKDVLRKLEQRPDYLDLILDQATAPSTAIALHQALVHALKTLDAERITVQQLASRVHNLDDEFSIKCPRPAETGEDALASQKKLMLESQLIADNGNAETHDGSLPASKAAVLGDEGLSKMASSIDAGPTEPSKATPRPKKEKDTQRNEPSATMDTGKCPHRVLASDQIAEQGPAICHPGGPPQISRPTATTNTAHRSSVLNRALAVPHSRSIAALTSTGDGKYTLMMRSRLGGMEQGEICPRCDRCRRQDLECMSFRAENQRPRVRCLGCNNSHSNCTWFNVTSEEIKWLNNSRQDETEEGARVEASVAVSQDATSSGDAPGNNDENTQTTSFAPAPVPAMTNEEHQDFSTPALRPNLPSTDKDYTAEMKKRASKLKRFEEMPLRCDRCRRYGWSCAAYTSKCFDCARNGKSCTWTNLNPEEIRSLNDSTTNDEDDDVEVLKEVIVLD